MQSSKIIVVFIVMFSVCFVFLDIVGTKLHSFLPSLQTSLNKHNDFDMYSFQSLTSMNCHSLFLNYSKPLKKITQISPVWIFYSVLPTLLFMYNFWRTEVIPTSLISIDLQCDQSNKPSSPSIGCHWSRLLPHGIVIIDHRPGAWLSLIMTAIMKKTHHCRTHIRSVPQVFTLIYLKWVIAMSVSQWHFLNAPGMSSIPH